MIDHDDIDKQVQISLRKLMDDQAHRILQEARTTAADKIIGEMFKEKLDQIQLELLILDRNSVEYKTTLAIHDDIKERMLRVSGSSIISGNLLLSGTGEFTATGSIATTPYP